MLALLPGPRPRRRCPRPEAAVTRPARARLHRRAAAGLAVAALATLSCGGIDLGEANVFSLQDEWQLGRQIAADVRKQMDVVRDPEVNRLINELGMQVVNQSDMAQLPWEFHVVRNEEVNAFNIPGGHVYVHTGLIEASGSGAELMGVIAHEVAHGTERHATQQLTKAYGIGTLLELVLGNNPGTLEGIAANIAAGGTLSHYSREAEREADEVGIRLMARAGWDPQGMVSFFEKLLEMRRARPGKVSQFFASHPLTETRIARARETIAGLPPAGRRTDSDTFRRLQGLVR